ncbi:MULTISPECIES: hypothetical protein [Vibrio harveyi group]|nr:MULTISPECIES: hypothetical protein [Vibrio harveyi group]
MNSNTMFSALGVLYVDHYTVTTRDLMDTLKDFLSIPSTKLLRGPGEDPNRNVLYAFVELNGIGVVEILSPTNDNSPITEHAGAYNLCYTVQDLDSAVKTAEERFDAVLVESPKVEIAFDGRRSAFLKHPSHGLFKLLESIPTSIAFDISHLQSDEQCVQKDKLLAIYNNVVGDRETEFNNVNMKSCAEWDSFKHLLLMMEVEKQFEVKIPAAEMSSLSSLDKIDAYLSKK